jgi:hypothetical protein
MARSTNRGAFNPQFPDKYTGEYPIVYRSSWELEFMRYCDHHPEVMEWASEPMKIPYKNPLNGKQTVYIPDFLVTYMNKGGATTTKLIEIKPLHEASESHARSRADVAIRSKNEAKWGAATQWSARRGIDFLVLTEAELYSNHANRKGRAHPIKAVGKQQVKAPNPTRVTKVKKQTAANLGTASRNTRSQSKTRLGGSVSTVGKVRKAMRAKKR